MAHEPNMKIPIFSSIYNEKYRPIVTSKINIKILNNLKLEKINLKKYPCVKILNKITNKNTLFETVLVSANDELVNLYLMKKINFLDIYKNLMKILRIKKYSKLINKKPKHLREILNLSKEVRLKTMNLCIK